jgi:hypothetical protein
MTAALDKVICCLCMCSATRLSLAGRERLRQQQQQQQKQQHRTQMLWRKSCHGIDEQVRLMMLDVNWR